MHEFFFVLVVQNSTVTLEKRVSSFVRSVGSLIRALTSLLYVYCLDVKPRVRNFGAASGTKKWPHRAPQPA